jgi:hypothetical protein
VGLVESFKQLFFLDGVLLWASLEDTKESPLFVEDEVSILRFFLSLDELE